MGEAGGSGLVGCGDLDRQLLVGGRHGVEGLLDHESLLEFLGAGLLLHFSELFLALQINGVGVHRVLDDRGCFLLTFALEENRAGQFDAFFGFEDDLGELEMELWIEIDVAIEFSGGGFCDDRGSCVGTVGEKMAFPCRTSRPLRAGPMRNGENAPRIPDLPPARHPKCK